MRVRVRVPRQAEHLAREQVGHIEPVARGTGGGEDGEYEAGGGVGVGEAGRVERGGPGEG